MKSLVLALGSLLLALALGEAALRVLGFYRPPDWPPRQVSLGLYRPDPATGYRLFPSTRTCLRYPEEDGPVLEVISNADGFRSSRELAGPDPRPRIAVLGDSLVFGLGVEEGERFTEVLEELEPRWRVDNLGMTGFGLDLMVRTLEALGRKVQPDVVVLAIYTDDFRRANPRNAAMGFPIPRFVLAGGELREIQHPVPTGARRLRLWQLAQDLAERRDPNWLALNEALFERFRALTLELGARPAALFLPGRADLPRDRARRDAVKDWAERRGVPFRDLTRPLHDAGVETVHIPNNSHWNARGHRIVAEALRELLASDVLKETQADPAPPANAPAPPWRARGWSFCHDAVIEGPEPGASPAGAGARSEDPA